MLHESELLKAVQAEVERIRKQVVSEVEQMRREALAEADKIRLEAENDGARVREGADHYAESVLTRIDTDLNNLGTRLQESQSIVRNGQRLLGQAKRTASTMSVGVSTPLAPAPLSSPLLSSRSVD
jgi:Skp family chaperone for outer membrane proteins